jgi:pimeloyl-ACP methyl ester carboxylesterase
VSGLRPPPKPDTGSRVLLRILTLILLLLVAGVIIWSAVIIQRIDLTETLTSEDLDLANPAQVGDLEINVVGEGSGPVVVLLHDFDVAGGVLWDGVVAQLGEGFTAVRIDLPGLGLSTRITEPGDAHTVGAMAEVVSQVLADRYPGEAATYAGVGLGGEVAAEVAVRHPGQVSGLVLVDVDFYTDAGWFEFIERLPFVGRAVTYAFEGGGPMSQSRWAPNCEAGGWCPTQEQSEARDLAESLVGTTDSLRSFRRTPASSFVPARLDEIAVPTVFVWSSAGTVPEESVDEAVGAITGATRADVDAWKAHLEEPAAVADAIRSVQP